jgi:4-amino-4-deoxy-L-arabinose transferase-like glycosyltransferase
MMRLEWLWFAVSAGSALVLAYLGQMQLERQPPQYLGSLIAFVSAAALLFTAPRMPAPLCRPQGGVAAGLLGLSGAALSATLYLRAQSQPALALITAAWLVAMAGFVVVCAWLDYHRSDLRGLDMGWTWTDTALLTGVFIIALALRAIGLESAPMTMLGDEGAMAMEAVRVLRHQTTDPFTTGWLSHPTLWFFLQAYSLRVFGESLAGVRMLSAFIGSATVATTFFLARLLYGRRVAAIAALLLATYHFHIHFSRLALNNIADPLIGTLVILGLVIGLYTRRLLAFSLAGIFLGLGLYFYHGTRLFFPLVLMLGTLWLLGRWRCRRGWRRPGTWKPVLVLAAGTLIAAGPLLQTFSTAPHAFTARVDIEGITHPGWLENEARLTGQTPVGVLWRQFVQAVLAFNSTTDTSGFYDGTRPLLWGLAAALMLLGLLLALRWGRRWAYQIPVAWFFLAVIFGGMLLKAPPKSPRFVTLAPVVCLFIAFVIEYMLQGAAQLLARRSGAAKIPQVLASALVVYLAAVSVTAYFGDYVRREQLGGVNTQAANALARYLQTQPGGTKVWFLGPPRMYYHGFELLNFLARDADAADVVDPIRNVAGVPVPAATRPTVYAALPERQEELQFVQERYPGGTFMSLHWPVRPEPLLYVYTVPPQR